MATLEQIASAIRRLEIQGAQTIAEAAVRAWAQAKDKKRASRLLRAARPTEPMLFNALDAVEHGADPDELIRRFRQDKQKIARIGAKLVRNNTVVSTHCHSSTVTAILKEAWKQGKRFVVHATETRPLFQGRLTAAELAKAGIPVHFFVDSAMLVSLRNAGLCLVGTDWVSPQGVANKIGTHAFAELAQTHGIPLYCCTHSWKYSPKHITIEQRPANEVWKNPSKGVRVSNPAFETAKPEEITGIVSEHGILTFSKFVKKMQKVMR